MPKATVVGHQLRPDPSGVLKREDGTLVWRYLGPNGHRLVAKVYRHRGRFYNVWGRVYRYRAEREHLRLRHLAEAAVATTPSHGWSAGWTPEYGYYNVLVMDEIEGAVPLSDWLDGGGSTGLLPGLLRSVRGMHEAGLVHQSLLCRNIFVASAEDGPTGLIADVDKMWNFPRSIVGSLMARNDLRDLVFSLGRHGIERDAVPLGAYGLDRLGRERVFRSLRWLPQSKLQRRVRDIDIRLRYALARFVLRRPRAGPPDVPPMVVTLNPERRDRVRA